MKYVAFTCWNRLNARFYVKSMSQIWNKERFMEIYNLSPEEGKKAWRDPKKDQAGNFRGIEANLLVYYSGRRTQNFSQGLILKPFTGSSRGPNSGQL